jgi:monoamine oxidase
MTNTTGIDAWGAWFEGVTLLKDKEPEAIDVEIAKSKHVAIVGAGMAGLMSYLVLSQAGMTKISIIEASQRLGGRVHTEYLSGGPFNYSYQEMGPMRFPATYRDAKTNTTVNITDHQMVFQLAEEMNRINGYDKNLSIDFIPWLQSSRNGLVYRNGVKLATGLPPTVAQIAANASLSTPTILDASTKALLDTVDSFMPDSSFNVEMANNMFKAHKDWLGRIAPPNGLPR